MRERPSASHAICKCLHWHQLEQNDDKFSNGNKKFDIVGQNCLSHSKNMRFCEISATNILSAEEAVRPIRFRHLVHLNTGYNYLLSYSILISTCPNSNKTSIQVHSKQQLYRFLSHSCTVTLKDM